MEVSFDMIFGAMALALGLFVLGTAYGVFRSPGKRLKSLHFDRSEDGSSSFRVELRKWDGPGAMRRFWEALNREDAQAQDTAKTQAVSQTKADP